MRNLVKHLHLLIIVVAFASCSTDVEKIKIIDLYEQDSLEIRELIKEELSLDTFDIIINAVKRYKENDQYRDVRSKTVRYVIDDQVSYNEKIAPRKEIYDIAVNKLKETLKAPSTARISKLKLEDYDGVKIKYDLERKDDSSYVDAEIKYESQNAFGTYLSGTHISNLKRDSTGNWIVWYWRNR